MRRASIWLIVGALALTTVLGFALAESAQLFGTDIEAQKHCSADIVVWVNTPTGIYHFKGMRWYRSTRTGAFVCQKEADQAGYRATRNGQ
jgi:hypothetical protein